MYTFLRDVVANYKEKGASDALGDDWSLLEASFVICE